MNTIKIRRLEDNDIALMKKWLEKEYVRRWYEDPEDWLYEIQNRNDTFSFITHYIVLYNEIEIGFCQYYACVDANEDWYGYVPMKGSYSIDYMIGEERYLKKGLGNAIVEVLSNKVFSIESCQRIIVQPDEDNKASYNTLLSNGYTFDVINKLYYRNKR